MSHQSVTTSNTARGDVNADGITDLTVGASSLLPLIADVAR
jgi:hypothetical protein